jgi:hypothetical protein
MPMTMVLVMVFNISVALALGFTIGRIYQIRSDELERRRNAGKVKGRWLGAQP